MPTKNVITMIGRKTHTRIFGSINNSVIFTEFYPRYAQTSMKITAKNTVQILFQINK